MSYFAVYKLQYFISSLTSHRWVSLKYQKKVSKWSFFQDREDYCREMTTKPSKKLETISNETLEYPFQQAYDEGKTVWNLSPSMMTGHLEGEICNFFEWPRIFNRSWQNASVPFYFHIAC